QSSRSHSDRAPHKWTRPAEMLSVAKGAVSASLPHFARIGHRNQASTTRNGLAKTIMRDSLLSGLLSKGGSGSHVRWFGMQYHWAYSNGTLGGELAACKFANSTF